MVIVHRRIQGQHVRSAKSKKFSSLVSTRSGWLLEVISHTTNKNLLSIHLSKETKDRPSKTFVEMRHCFEEVVFKACCFSGFLSLLCNSTVASQSKEESSVLKSDIPYRSPTFQFHTFLIPQVGMQLCADMSLPEKYPSC